MRDIGGDHLYDGSSAQARHDEEEMYRVYRGKDPGPIGSIARCARCGHGEIEFRRFYGRDYVFDKGTEKIHVCRPTDRELMNAIRRDLADGGKRWEALCARIKEIEGDGAK